MEPLGILGSLAGGLLNNIFAGNRQREGQEFAREQAATAEANFRVNRQTAYQDTMADMRNAGLNPILAYQRGATSSTMGTTPSVSAAPVSDVGIGAGINSALAIRRQNQELENMRSTQRLTDAQTARTDAETLTEKSKPANVEAQTDQFRAQTGLTYNQLAKGMAEAMQSTQLADWIANNKEMVKAAEVAGYMGGKFGEVAKPFLDAARGLLGGATGNSAPSIIRGAPMAPPGNSSKNLGDVIGSGSFNPNQHRLERGGPAPPRPNRGWFNDRFYGVDQ